MTKKLLLILAAALFNAFLITEVESISMPPSEMYLYGTITTIDNEQYTGQIRWGNEEAFWFDFFNSSKPENDNIDYLSDEDLEALERKCKKKRKSWIGWSNAWNDCNHLSTHSFACQFGDIKSIQPMRGERISVVLRNNEVLRLDGGSNDVGATIRVSDAEMGVLKIKWDRIDKIEFNQAETPYESAFGTPLYGTVKTSEGTFKGFLQWDHDERLTNDELNGESKNGELDILFGNIKSIAKTYRGSEVTLLSGRQFDLRGSNDVDDDNRGIIVNLPGVGRVDIPWEEFISIEFGPAPNSAPTYQNFNIIKPINGTVITLDEDEMSGDIVYDLDESYDLEILDGMVGHLEYSIPFRYIDSIQPKSDDESLVKLKNGKSLLLSDKVDVTEENDGVLIKSSRAESRYVIWEEVGEIRLY